ncbi:hypothetical protein B0H13DRAFT_2053184 [Mycena leptocephala]|nr:hypothetical protein B0H13DRAFT_2053184 [Mycena leptocephala]
MSLSLSSSSLTSTMPPSMGITPSPLSACSSMSSIGSELPSLSSLSSLNADSGMGLEAMPVDFSMYDGAGLMAPFDLDLDFGFGLGLRMDAGAGMDAGMGYLTGELGGNAARLPRTDAALPRRWLCYCRGVRGSAAQHIFCSTCHRGHSIIRDKGLIGSIHLLVHKTPN